MIDPKMALYLLKLTCVVPFEIACWAVLVIPKIMSQSLNCSTSRVDPLPISPTAAHRQPNHGTNKDMDASTKKLKIKYISSGRSGIELVYACLLRESPFHHFLSSPVELLF